VRKQLKGRRPTEKIIVVDDDRNLLKVITLRLESLGYEVTSFQYEEEAKRAIAAETFDLAVIDLQLIQQDGISLMEEFHQTSPGMPAIILTAHGSIESAVEAMRRGAYTYLTKPFNASELALQVERALGNGRLTSRINDLQQQREDLLHTVSHDLRIPITVVQGHAEILRFYMEQSADSNLLESIDAILQASSRMNAMVEELLDVARLEEGRLVLEKQLVDFPELVVKMLRFYAEAMDADRIETDFSPDLSPIFADPFRLERILTNLITNSLKFSPPDSPVRITARNSGNEVVFAVIDRGVGIAAEDLPHIFERFHLSKRGCKADSVGLGLYITRMLVEAHGGRLWVKSMPGEGSTFSVALQAARSQAASTTSPRVPRTGKPSHLIPTLPGVGPESDSRTGGTRAFRKWKSIFPKPLKIKKRWK
jgi:signal transduction histidine kinase